MSPASWKPLGANAPETLVEPRLQLHYAAQVVSGVGRTLIEEQADDSHTNLGWDAELGALTSRQAPGPRPFSAALDVAGFRLLLLDEGGRPSAALTLAGQSLSQAYDWLQEAISARRGEPLQSGFAPLHYDLPAHPLGEGAAFAQQLPNAFLELSHWFHNAALLLEEVREAESGASEVRCWPHHFDIATLIDEGGGRSIGLGLSPGDHYYPEPYFYCSGYPQPDKESLPDLSGPGHWHTHEFKSIVLNASSFEPGVDWEQRRDGSFVKQLQSIVS